MSSIAGWRITGLVAIVLALMTMISFVSTGFNEDSLRGIIRGTARSSIILFVLAFTASSLFHVFKTNWAKYLLRNRKFIGVSFALSHFVHLLFLILLIVLYPEDSLAKLHIIEIVLASLAYILILLMTITSFATPRRWIGEKSWHYLHTFGAYLIWLIFLETYSRSAMQNGQYIPLVILLLAAFGLRIMSLTNSKQDKIYSP